MRQMMHRLLVFSLLFSAVVMPAGAYNIGDRGVQVMKIQKQLVKYGYPIGTDGIYGSETARAVQRFQADKGLDIDGIVDSKTYKKLLGSSMPKNEAKRAEKAKSKTFAMKTKYPSSRNYTEYSKIKKFTSHDVIGDRLVSTANKYVGVPYVFGGNTPSGFDCSGFTRYVFSHNGINLPRMADEQYRIGSAVSRSELIPGDLVFFSTYEPGASHAGIYVGDNQFISATSSGGIRVDSMDSGYWASRYVGAKRVR